MDVRVRQTGEIETLVLTEPKSGKNTAQDFIVQTTGLDYCGSVLAGSNLKAYSYDGIGLAIGGERIIHDDDYQMWLEILESQQTNLDLINKYAKEQTTTLLLDIELERVFDDEMKKNGDPVFKVMNAIAAQHKVITRLLTGKIIIADPVPNEFWPPTQTSNTFRILSLNLPAKKYESIIVVNAQADFEMALERESNCRFTAGIRVHYICDDKNCLEMVAIFCEFPYVFSHLQEQSILKILFNGIHREFSIRGISDCVHRFDIKTC